MYDVLFPDSPCLSSLLVIYCSHLRISKSWKPAVTKKSLLCSIFTGFKLKIKSKGRSDEFGVMQNL